MNYLNKKTPGQAQYVVTNFGGGGHCCWGNFYGNGNTVTGLGAITGGSGYTNGTYTNVTMTTIPNIVASEYPVANITVSGGTVT